MPDPYPAVELRRPRVLLAQTITARHLARNGNPGILLQVDHFAHVTHRRCGPKMGIDPAPGQLAVLPLDAEFVAATDSQARHSSALPGYRQSGKQFNVAGVTLHEQFRKGSVFRRVSADNPVAGG